MRSLPAVPKKRMPSEEETCVHARPTPPAAACTNAVMPDDERDADVNAVSAVRKIVGVDAAASWLMDIGFGGNIVDVHTLLARLPPARPNTLSPTHGHRDDDDDDDDDADADTWSTVPEKSDPGIPGSPGYISSTFRRSRKFTPTAHTDTQYV